MSSVAPQKVLDPRQFSTWSQQDWQGFVQSLPMRGKDRADRKFNMLLLSPPFQHAFLEVGLFGSDEFFKKVPTFLNGTAGTSQRLQELLTRYPITRIMNHRRSGPAVEYMLFEIDENKYIEIRYVQNVHERANVDERIYGYWIIETPPRERYEELMELIERPEIYAQIIATLRVQNAARQVLEILLPRPVTNLALEYAGYPQKPKKSFEQLSELVYQDFSARVIKTAPFDFDDPMQSQRIEGSERAADVIADYVSGDDRLEEGSL